LTNSEKFSLIASAAWFLVLIQQVHVFRLLVHDDNTD